MNINECGWNDQLAKDFHSLFKPPLLPARIAAQYKSHYSIVHESGEARATLAGRFLHNTPRDADLPAVGDWVAVTKADEESKAVIHGLLPRRSKFSRTAPDLEQRSGTAEQVLVANIDLALILSSLNEEFSLRRIERYLTMVWNGGAVPLLVLTKVDECADRSEFLEAIGDIAMGVPVLLTSAVQGEGLDALREYLKPGRTAVMLGSSGVGKSTLMNALMGRDVTEVAAISDYKDRGRHTTTHRQLYLLPQGSIIIDTPGLREIHLWSDEEGFGRTFQDIEELAASCRFSDCRHGEEPGCAVQLAIVNGELNEGRLRSFHKLQREIAYQENRISASTARREERKRSKLYKEHRKMLRLRNRLK